MNANPPPAAQPVARYTIEPHGGAYALYAGRDNQHHGWNLARISEPDTGVLDLIVNALNRQPDPRIAKLERQIVELKSKAEYDAIFIKAIADASEEAEREVLSLKALLRDCLEMFSGQPRVAVGLDKRIAAALKEG